MIYQEITEHTFAYELSENPDNGFSYEGARELFHYLEGFGDDIEFDPIALRCVYSEYTEEELMNAYWKTLVWWDEEEYGDLTDEEKFENLRDFIEQNTTLLVVDDNTYIILDF